MGHGGLENPSYYYMESLNILNSMAQPITNFARFYAAFNRLPSTGDREELKRNIVLQYTWNRTDNLREMTLSEYEDCCRALERLTGQPYDLIRQELRRRRSVCLKLMQQMGVDTTDWERVNELCRHPRLTGKNFRELDTEELEALAVKLRIIKKKGGLKPREETTETKQPGNTVCYVIRPDAPKN